jgi:hypothetical protein
LVIVHVDLSVVPDRYLEFARQYPIVLNGEVKDIRKSTFSKLLLKSGDSYEGKVIVKSNLNYAGQPERMRGILPSSQPSGAATDIPGVQGAPAPLFDSPLDYQLYDRLEDVPRSWLDDPNLVVEKFLPEKEGDLYHTRTLLFFG